MTGVHGLDHVQSFTPPDLAYHNTVRPHAETGFYKVTHSDLFTSLNIGITGFQPYQVGNTLYLQFGTIFDRDNSRVLGYEV